MTFWVGRPCVKVAQVFLLADNDDFSAVSHRLAPGSKFPSHLFQAYSAFVYLRSLGYERIVVGGDSGGANVALQLHHYLQKKDTESLKHIVGIFMICAWLDLSDDHKEKKSEYASEDQISTSLLEKGARSLQTGGVPVLSNIWLSPFSWIKEDSSLLASLPPIYALTGEIGELDLGRHYFLGAWLTNFHRRGFVSREH